MLEIVKLNKDVDALIINRLFEIHSNNFLEFDKMTFENFKNEFVLENRIYFIAKLDDKIIGYIGIINCVDFFEIIGIGVDSPYQKMGIGTNLLSKVLNTAKELKINKIFLEVDETNTKAKNFYKKNGFLITNIRKNYYKNNDALVMVHSVI